MIHGLTLAEPIHEHVEDHAILRLKLDLLKGVVGVPTAVASSRLEVLVLADNTWRAVCLRYCGCEI
jgi:hypothetical protein